MIITISGIPGAGKSTVAKEVAKKLRLKYVSIGASIREKAKSLGKNLHELMQDKHAFAQIQREVESHLERLGEQDEVVIDGRDAFYHMQSALNVFLIVDENVAAQRIYLAQRPTEQFTSVTDAKQSLRKRRDTEQQLYQDMHGIDIYDNRHYTLVIDTTHLRVEEIVEQIVDLAH